MSNSNKNILFFFKVTTKDLIIWPKNYIQLFFDLIYLYFKFEAEKFSSVNNLWTDDFDSRYIVRRRGLKKKRLIEGKEIKVIWRKQKRKMKFDEEDLLDLINGPLKSPAKSQKDSENDLLQNEIHREQDIISVSS